MFGTMSQKLVSNQEDDLEAFGYVRCWIKSFIFYTICLLSLGTLALIFYWYPHIHIYSTYKKCSLRVASKILIVNDYKGKFKTYFIKNVKTVSVKNYRARESSRKNFSRQEIERLQNTKLHVSLENGTRIRTLEYRAFWCKKQCYVWDEKKYEFSKLASMDRYTNCSEIYLSKNTGLSQEEQFLRRVVYGYNEIKVPVNSIPKLIIVKVLDPLNIIYEISLAVWMPLGYYYYASTLLLILIYGCFRTLTEVRKNQLRLRKKVLETSQVVRVLRNSGISEDISSAELVPGDIIELPSNKQAAIVCDAILLTGVCVVNESMLTGESTPITKSALQPWDVLYDLENHANHTLFCGTTILQTKNHGTKPILAQVIRTGIQTSKGALISAIMYPPALGFKFEKESRRIIAIVLSLACCGFIYTSISKNLNGFSTHAILQALSVFSLIVPPALPVIMLVGAAYSQSRLKKAGIYCTDTRVINEAGRINCVCFDKTGTLTEEELELMGVVPNENNKLGELEKNSSRLKDYPIFEGMLVCHSLSVIGGKVIGNPIDQKMYEMTGWSLGETEVQESHDNQTIRTVYSPNNNILFPKKREIRIIQEYLFSSELQRMSVVARFFEPGKLRVYSKGSPEMILSLSRPETRPNNFSQVLQGYTKKGCRVIALAFAELDADSNKFQVMPRESVERDLNFLGLIVFKNQLKDSTVSVIDELREANVRTIMITGDNMQTAVSVARECGIITPEETVLSVTVENSSHSGRPNLLFLEDGSLFEQKRRFSLSNLKIIERQLDLNRFRLAMSGSAWRTIYESYPHLVPKICKNGVVFARMAINQKRQLIIELMQLGHLVAMCGDGANDCAALKAAHVGISLSETQSGVASSFTSTTPDITCVLTVMKEGRATLVSSFGLFKLILISCMIEFGSTMVLNAVNLKISDFQYMFIELGLTMSVNFSFGNTKPRDGKLTNKLPITSFFNFVQVFSFLFHTFVMVAMHVVVLLLVRRQSWYEKVEKNCFSSYEDYSIFCLSMFQYVMSAVLFSSGKPHRKPVYTNYFLVLCLSFLTAVSVYLTLGSEKWVTERFMLRVPPTFDWRFKILAFAVFNAGVCLFFEKVVLRKIKCCLNKLKSVRETSRSEVEEKNSNNLDHSIAIDCSGLSNRNIKDSIVYDNAAFVNDETIVHGIASNVLCSTRL